MKICDLEKNSEAIKVVKPKFNKDMRSSEGVGELTLREREARTLRSFHRHRVWVKGVEGRVKRGGTSRAGATARGRKWARSLSSHPQGRRWSGMGERALQVYGDEQGSQCSLTQVEATGHKTIWKMSEAKDRGDVHRDQTYATNIGRREVVHQELWSAHLESPTFALSEALRKVEMWEDEDSSAGDKADFM